MGVEAGDADRQQRACARVAALTNVSTYGRCVVMLSLESVEALLALVPTNNKSCAACGRRFNPRRRDARFCSDACRKAWRRMLAKMSGITVTVRDKADKGLIDAGGEDFAKAVKIGRVVRRRRRPAPAA